MEVPLEISYRNIDKTEGLEELIQEKVDKLDSMADNLISCRVAVERPNRHQRDYRIRIDLRVAPNQEIVVQRKAIHDGGVFDPLQKMVREAFAVARRQLDALLAQQRREVKPEIMPETMGLVTALFRKEGYGFLKTLDGREVYFHRNSVLHGEFERLEIGTGVRFAEQEGEKGPQASTVEIVNKPGSRIKKEDGGVDLFQAPRW